MNTAGIHNDISAAVLIFATSIESEQDVLRVAPFLNGDNAILRWNVDREDVDHILRIESDGRDAEYFIRLVSAAGFACEELPD